MFPVLISSCLYQNDITPFFDTHTEVNSICRAKLSKTSSLEYNNICLILWSLMFGEINYLFVFVSSVSLSCVPSLPPPLSLLCSQGQSYLSSLTHFFFFIFPSPRQQWESDCGPDRQRQRYSFSSLWTVNATHTQQLAAHCCLLVFTLQRV